MGEDERSGNRRGGHDEKIGVATLAGQSEALMHAEAMLFIDNRQAKVLESDVGLEQRVCAHGYGDGAIGDAGQDGAASGSGHLAGQ
ncbi:hypothetical protein D3C87_1260670 [compost metagenome]